MFGTVCIYVYICIIPWFVCICLAQYIQICVDIGYVHTNMLTCVCIRVVVYGCLGCAVYNLENVIHITVCMNAQPCEVALCVTSRIGDTVKASLVGTIPLSGGNAVQELEIFSHLPTLLERKEKKSGNTSLCNI